MSVLHTETLRDHPKLCKSKSLIKMSCVDIASHNRIKLKYAKTVLFSLLNDLVEGCRISGDIKLDGVDIYKDKMDVNVLRKPTYLLLPTTIC